MDDKRNVIQIESIPFYSTSHISIHHLINMQMCILPVRDEFEFEYKVGCRYAREANTDTSFAERRHGHNAALRPVATINFEVM